MSATHFKVVVMGVSGCGKSTFGASLAGATGAAFIEGDAYHLLSSSDKMRRGVALEDADREPWLDRLAVLLAEHAGPVVLSCSALRKAYRDRLRAGVPGLRFIFLQISPSAAVRRVSLRPAHDFPVSLVASQFESLESPQAEPAVLVIGAEQPASSQLEQALDWLGCRSGHATSPA